MDESRVKRMVAIAKKLEKANEDLEVLIDAQLFQEQQIHIPMSDIAKEMKSASEQLRKAIHSLAIAEAMTELDPPLDGQMSMDND